MTASQGHGLLLTANAGCLVIPQRRGTNWQLPVGRTDVPGVVRQLAMDPQRDGMEFRAIKLIGPPSPRRPQYHGLPRLVSAEVFCNCSAESNTEALRQAESGVLPPAGRFPGARKTRRSLHRTRTRGARPAKRRVNDRRILTTRSGLAAGGPADAGPIARGRTGGRYCWRWRPPAWRCFSRSGRPDR